MTLENQIAFITGAGRGLGRAIALRLARLADVVLSMLTQGRYVLLDEVTVHPLQQDF